MGVRNTLKKAATGEADQERCVILGHYIVENNATVRAAAKKFGVSKSTVHQDITAKLAQVDRRLHDEPCYTQKIRGAVPPKNEPENKMKKALPKGGL